MINVESVETTKDVSHEVHGNVGKTKFHVLVQCRNGEVHSVIFQDSRLNKYLTESEKDEITIEMKKKYSK